MINNQVIINPTADQLNEAKKFQAQFQAEKDELDSSKTCSAITLMATRSKCANIGTVGDTEALFATAPKAWVCTGTEFPMDCDALPTEDGVRWLTKKWPKPCRINRSSFVPWDIGGDKELPP